MTNRLSFYWGQPKQALLPCRFATKKSWASQTTRQVATSLSPGVFVWCGFSRCPLAPKPVSLAGSLFGSLVSPGPWVQVGLQWDVRIGVLFGSFGRTVDGFRFLVCLVVFSHLPGISICLPQKDTYVRFIPGPARSSGVLAAEAHLDRERGLGHEDHHADRPFEAAVLECQAWGGNFLGPFWLVQGNFHGVRLLIFETSHFSGSQLV